MAIIFSIVVGIFMCFEPITDNDWFWHYVIGNYIHKNGIIPKQELFTWVDNYSWTSHEWLTELIMYLAGPIGNLIIMVVIFIFLYIFLAKLLKLEFKRIFDFRLCYFIMLTVFFKVTGPRPYIISLLFLAYFVYILFNYIDDSKKYSKLIYTIPILQILWVNFHGGSSSLPYLFIIGVLLCDAFLKIFKFNEERWTSFKLEKFQVITLLKVLGLTLVATCLNPFGIGMLIYPFTNMADTSMLDYILEWQSADFHGFFGLYIFIMVAFPLFNMILSRKKMKLHEIAFQLLFLYMAMKSQRFIGMYSIYSCWNLGKYFFVSDEMYLLLKKPFKKLLKIIRIIAICLFILIAIFVGYIQIRNFVKMGVIDNDGFYSDKGIKKVIELNPQRLYNDYPQGGYLLYKLNEFDALDKIKIFGYGLGDVFSGRILPDSKNIQDLTKDTRELIQSYDFDVILTTSTHQLHYFIEEMEEYELYYSDDMCYVFVKK